MAGDKLSIYRSPEVAASYDRRWRGVRGRARDLRKQRAIARALDHFPAARSVLDVPCGTGRFTELVLARGLGYVGADAAPAMLRQASEKHGGARLVAGDLARLPFADGSFDVALCVRLMHLVREAELRRSFLSELARVARMGVVVDYRHDRALRVWWAKARAKLGLRERAPEARRLEAIAAELETAGLRLRSFVAVRRVPYLSDKVVVVAVPTEPAPAGTGPSSSRRAPADRRAPGAS